ncbi:MAG: fatty acid desaturase [Armatimonadetes bacterium]|nr:fatty acid desaturase [Armatimonadota bacterium]
MTPTLRPLPTRAEWGALVRPYQQPNPRLACSQLLTTFVPMLAFIAVALVGVRAGCWWALLASLPAGCLVIRAFIIQHDCGHGSFLSQAHWNDRVGLTCSLFTFTPYVAWRHDHAVHHATAGSLQRRGTGDIRTLTVAEYAGGSRAQRAWYRVYRHPLALFLIGPFLHFVFAQRWPYAVPAEEQRERRSVHITNLMLLLAFVVLSWYFGALTVVLVTLPIIAVAASSGVYLFYVQHQFDPGYWSDQADWDFTAVALHGSSYLRLPRALEWITGSIGYHHIHHLCPRIPNYNLRRCHEENPLLQVAPEITLWSSLKTIPLALWDEQQKRLVTFREAELRRAA